MNKTATKNEVQKQLNMFRDQMHELLMKYPEIRLAGDENGDVLAWMPESEVARNAFRQVYLPRSGKSELINK